MIFDENLEKLAKDHFGLDGNSEVTDNKMQKYIFDEMLLQVKRAQQSGGEMQVFLSVFAVCDCLETKIR